MEAPSKPRNKKSVVANKKKVFKKRSTKKKVETKKRSFNATSVSVKWLRKSFFMTPLEFVNLVGVGQTSIVNWEHQRGKLNHQQRTKDALDKTSGLTLNQAKRRLKTRLAKK